MRNWYTRAENSCLSASTGTALRKWSTFAFGDMDKGPVDRDSCSWLSQCLHRLRPASRGQPTSRPMSSDVPMHFQRSTNLSASTFLVQCMHWLRWLECRADKGLGTGVTMIELFGVQEFSFPRPHSSMLSDLFKARICHPQTLPELIRSQETRVFLLVTITPVEDLQPPFSGFLSQCFSEK